MRFELALNDSALAIDKPEHDDELRGVVCGVGGNWAIGAAVATEG